MGRRHKQTFWEWCQKHPATSTTTGALLATWGGSWAVWESEPVSWTLATIAGTATAWAWIGWRISHAKRTAVYYLYAFDGRLLYVGMTSSPRHRFPQHAADKWWWTRVDERRTRVVWYWTRTIAATVEWWEIRRLDPACNKKHRRRGAQVWCGPEEWYTAA